MIEFDRETHTYTVDGKVVPCVSEIIAPLGADMDEGDELEFAIERAAERGTVFHRVLERHFRGEENITEAEVPSEYEPYMEAVRLFLSEHDIQPLFIETALFCQKHGIAGTPDLLCIMDGVLTLLDYKFVAQIAKAKVKAQLNAYRLGFEEKDIYPDVMYAIQFLKDGTYRLYPVAFDDSGLELCVALRAEKNKKHPRGRIE